MLPSLPGVKEQDFLFIYKQLKRVLEAPTKIYFFGSRLRGNHKTYSDLDMCIKGNKKLDFSQLNALEESFAESDIPYKIDISDFHTLDKDFQNHILNNSLEVLLDSASYD